MFKQVHKASTLSRIREQRVKQTKRTRNLVVRLTDDEMSRLESKARDLNLTRSEYCRAMVLGHRIRDKTPETRELTQHLIRGCGNLNQFQHYLNAHGKDDVTARKIKDIIDWFHQLRTNHLTKEKAND